jgi:3-keto-5-aminohexanoate cleavage enzyme
MGRKVIITAALAGSGRATKKDNRHIPENPGEIAEAAYKCWQAGAAIVHIHGRDWQGEVTADPAIFREIHGLIREKCDIILQDSTGLGAYVATEDRIKVIEAGRRWPASTWGPWCGRVGTTAFF